MKAFHEFRQWQDAALLKDRTRRAIRDRIRSGESLQSIADDFDVPLRFVEHLRQWQLFSDGPEMPKT